MERVSIQDKAITEIDSLKDKAAPAAILLNVDDWGYGHFSLDKASIKVFEQNLSKLNKGEIDRLVLLNQFVNMIH